MCIALKRSTASVAFDVSKRITPQWKPVQWCTAPVDTFLCQTGLNNQIFFSISKKLLSLQFCRESRFYSEWWIIDVKSFIDVRKQQSSNANVLTLTSYISACFLKGKREKITEDDVWVNIWSTVCIWCAWCIIYLNSGIFVYLKHTCKFWGK